MYSLPSLLGWLLASLPGWLLASLLGWLLALLLGWLPMYSLPSLPGWLLICLLWGTGVLRTLLLTRPDGRFSVRLELFTLFLGRTLGIFSTLMSLEYFASAAAAVALSRSRWDFSCLFFFLRGFVHWHFTTILFVTLSIVNKFFIYNFISKFKVRRILSIFFFFLNQVSWHSLSVMYVKRARIF